MALSVLPGSHPYPPELAERIEAALAALPADHRPRTRHYDGKEHLFAGEHADPYGPPGARPVYANRLLLQASPYLRQHAHNPVDWRPWGPEAFDEARQRNVPVFLSIGYSTCHWCHVMEHESFEDAEIARLLNSLYVPVKVDREERPDVDAVHMVAVQAMSGSGGWPMSVWLAPEPQGTVGLPFFAGTYFPPRDGMRGMRHGFATLLTQMSLAWQEDRERVAAWGRQVAEAVRGHLSGTEPSQRVHLEAVDRVAREVARTYDRVQGGRQVAPKFPSQVPAVLLLRQGLRTGDTASTWMAWHTLTRMTWGGIYDQVGGGLHRYSTDARWLVPHFEKMLYDQGLYVSALVECVAATGDEDLERAARETLDYLLREMRDPGGAFYSATDADSEGVEGKYFTWTPAEIEAALGPDDAEVVIDVFHVTRQGDLDGRAILHRELAMHEAARRRGLTGHELALRLRGALDRLLAVRQTRVPPLRDDKVLTAWNGLLITALCQAARQLDAPPYAQAAAEAADFLLDRHRPTRQGLARASLHGQVGAPAVLEDYAFLIQGLLELYQTDGNARWLVEALDLQAVQDLRFGDPQTGAWFSTPEDGETLLVRMRPDHDGAEPAGSSVAVRNLATLAALTGDDRFRQAAVRALEAHGGRLDHAPGSLTEMLLAVESLHAPLQTVVLVLPAGAGRSAAEPFLRAMRQVYAPHHVLHVVPEGEAQAELARLAPLVAGRPARDGQTTAYVCTGTACGLPTTEPDDLVRQLQPRAVPALPSVDALVY